MAMCVIAVVGDAPCQCFSPGENHTTSPGRISSTGPPSRCARPKPEVTISVWPSGWVCHAVRAPGSKVTLAPLARAGAGAANSGSMRTVPVNQSAGPLPEDCDPLRLMSMMAFLALATILSVISASKSRHRALHLRDRAVSTRLDQKSVEVDLDWRSLGNWPKSARIVSSGKIKAATQHRAREEP